MYLLTLIPKNTIQEDLVRKRISKHNCYKRTIFIKCIIFMFYKWITITKIDWLDKLKANLLLSLN